MERHKTNTSNNKYRRPRSAPMSLPGQHSGDKRSGGGGGFAKRSSLYEAFMYGGRLFKLAGLKLNELYDGDQEAWASRRRIVTKSTGSPFTGVSPAPSQRQLDAIMESSAEESVAGRVDRLPPSETSCSDSGLTSEEECDDDYVGYLNIVKNNLIRGGRLTREPKQASQSSKPSAAPASNIAEGVPDMVVSPEQGSSVDYYRPLQEKSMTHSVSNTVLSASSVYSTISRTSLMACSTLSSAGLAGRDFLHDLSDRVMSPDSGFDTGDVLRLVSRASKQLVRRVPAYPPGETSIDARGIICLNSSDYQSLWGVINGKGGHIHLCNDNYFISAAGGKVGVVEVPSGYRPGPMTLFSLKYNRSGFATLESVAEKGLMLSFNSRGDASCEQDVRPGSDTHFTVNVVVSASVVTNLQNICGSGTSIC